MEIDIEKCLDMLVRGEKLALATVLKVEGSAPRGPGAKMTIDATGNITGTVGGGMVEFLTIKAAQKAISEGRSNVSRFDLSLGKDHSIGMICGGSMEVLIDFVDASPNNRQFFEELRDCTSTNIPVSLITALENGGDGSNVRRSIFRHDGTPDETLPPWVLKALDGGSESQGFRFMDEDPDRRIIIDPIAPPTHVHIFGAGHIGLKLGELFNFVGLNTTIADDREGFATPERYPHAIHLHTIPGYKDIFDKIHIHKNSCIIITTQSAGNDKLVLEQSLRTPASYIGMIGSKTKINAIFSSLTEAGYSPSKLASVRTPIGLPIHAETPAEIAVSIVGEIIQNLRGLPRLTGNTRHSMPAQTPA